MSCGRVGMRIKVAKAAVEHIGVLLIHLESSLIVITTSNNGLDREWKIRDVFWEKFIDFIPADRASANYGSQLDDIVLLIDNGLT